MLRPESSAQTHTHADTTSSQQKVYTIHYETIHYTLYLYTFTVCTPYSVPVAAHTHTVATIPINSSLISTLTGIKCLRIKPTRIVVYRYERRPDD